MSKKPDSVSSASKTNPFTPIRRFFLKLELLKPIVALGKRGRDKSYVAEKPKHLPEQKSSRSNDHPLLDSTSSFVATTAARNVTFVKDQMQQQPPQQQHREGTARIALQQYDQPLDAIVITTLPSYPFCCHEDLLTMSHSQLVKVAMFLNSRLPICSQIVLADGIPDAHIRHSIETLVGIVPSMPGAPKAIKSRRFERMDISEIGDLEQDTLPSPPTSPLSMRVSRRQEKALPVMSSPPHLLECLEEEDENDFFTMNRPFKKRRKVSISMTAILGDEDIDMEQGTPTRARDFLRHNQRMIPALEWQQSSPSPISNPDVFKVDSTFVNMKPRYRSMGKSSTKKRKITSGGQPGSSRKPFKRDDLKKQAITFNYRPFELPTNNSGQYRMRIKPLSSASTKSSNSSDEKVAIAGAEDDSDNNTSWLRNIKIHNSGVEHEDYQVAGRIENLTVGSD